MNHLPNVPNFMKMKNTFKVIAYKNPFFIIQTFQVLFVCGLLLNSLRYSDSFVISIVLVSVALLGVLYVFHNATSKIYIFDKHILVGSILHKKKINIEDVAAVHICRRRLYTTDYLHRSLATSLNWIHLPTKNTRKGAIFQYNEPLYDALKVAVSKSQ